MRWTMLGLVLIAACGTGRTMVLDAPASRLHLKQANLREGQNTVQIPDEERAKIREIIEKQFEKRGVPQGGELTIEYRLIQFNKGSQFSRWMWGGIGNAGEGSLTLEATFLGADGRKLARVQAEGRIGSGAFGGAFSDAVYKAGNEILKFALDNFLDVPEPPKEGKSSSTTSRYG